MFNRESLIIRWDDEFQCYDVVVMSKDATVADYEKGCEEVFSSETAVRNYASSCFGCNKCCCGRIPVTLYDIYRLKAVGVGTELDIRQWIKKYARVKNFGKCLDICLSVMDDGVCIFWDRDRGKCRVYEGRPLVCRSYICAPLSWRGENLRTQVINSGEDELVNFLIGKSPSLIIDEKNFAMRYSYENLLLRDILTKRLWHYLTLID